jgi:type VI secretion system protein ImpB
MPKKESMQHKLDRVRPPRVHITYDVEIGDAIEMKELPFVVGVLGDFSGNPEKPLPKLKDRKLIEIDRDNFDQVLAGMAPRLTFRVDNKLADDDSKMNVELKFRSMDARQRLSDLLSKMDGNDRLDELLQEVIHNSGAQQQLSEALGIEAAGAEAKEDERE